MKWIFLLPLAAFTLPAHAETSIGPMAGVAFSHLTFSSDSGAALSLDSKTGLAGGVSADIGLSDSFSFQPEAIYIQKGSTIASGTTSAKINMDYIDVPLLLKPKFDLGSAKIYFLAGPSVAFKIGSSVTLGSASANLTEVKSTDFSLHAGFGIETKLASGFTGFFDFRYEHGLTDAANDPSLTTVTMKNRAWMLLVGGRFDI